jgi:hypothetical protein
MLRGHADNSVLREVLLRLRGLGTTDAAIRREYGFGVRELFARAFFWLKAQ